MGTHCLSECREATPEGASPLCHLLPWNSCICKIVVQSTLEREGKQDSRCFIYLSSVLFQGVALLHPCCVMVSNPAFLTCSLLLCNEGEAGSVGSKPAQPQKAAAAPPGNFLETHIFRPSLRMWQGGMGV